MEFAPFVRVAWSFEALFAWLCYLHPVTAVVSWVYVRKETFQANLLKLAIHDMGHCSVAMAVTEILQLERDKLGISEMLSKATETPRSSLCVQIFGCRGNIVGISWKKAVFLLVHMRNCTPRDICNSRNPKKRSHWLLNC